MDEEKRRPYNVYLILLLLIILLSFGLRYYYYAEHHDQALWYDEADYLLRAKAFAYEQLTDDNVALRKPVIMPMFWSILLSIGLGEFAIKFVSILISVLGIWFAYLLGREVYNKKLGLLMAAMMGFFWLHIFFSFRVMLDESALATSILAMYFFVRWYKKRKARDAIIAGILSSLAMMIFYIPLYLTAVYVGFLLLTRHLKFLKDKTFWYAVLAYIITALPWLIYNYVLFGDPIYGFTQYHGTGEILPNTDYGVGGFWRVFSYGLLTPMWVMMIFGLGKAVLDIGTSFDLLLKRKVKSLDMDLLFLIWGAIVTISLAIEVVHVEPRYMFPAFIPAFYFIGKGLLFIVGLIQKHVKGIDEAKRKLIAPLLLIAVVLFFGYTQLTFADEIINIKSTSFEQERYAGEWIRDNTPEDEVFLACNQVVAFQAYSDRTGYGFGTNTEVLHELIDEYDSNYVILNGYNPDCAFDYLGNSPELFQVAEAFYLDEAQTQPIVIIYQIVK